MAVIKQDRETPNHPMGRKEVAEYLLSLADDLESGKKGAREVSEQLSAFAFRVRTLPSYKMGTRPCGGKE